MAYRGALLAVMVALIVAGCESSGIFDEACKSMCPIDIRDCPSTCPSVGPCPTPSCPPPQQCPIPWCPIRFCTVRDCPVPNCPSCPPTQGCTACPSMNASCSEVESSEGSLETAACPPCRECPRNYVRFPRIGAYKYYPQRMTWMKANQTCAKEGAHLAVPKSQIEMDLILLVMEKHSQNIFPKVAHVGFYAPVKKGFFGFKTVLGKTMSSFQKSLWDDGFPKIGAYRKSVLVDSDGKLSNVFYINKDPFICQLPDH